MHVSPNHNLSNIRVYLSHLLFFLTVCITLSIYPIFFPFHYLPMTISSHASPLYFFCQPYHNSHARNTLILYSIFSSHVSPYLSGITNPSLLFISHCIILVPNSSSFNVSFSFYLSFFIPFIPMGEEYSFSYRNKNYRYFIVDTIVTSYTVSTNGFVKGQREITK